MIADLAYWFKWPLSEIEALEIEDLMGFHARARARAQAEAQAKAAKGKG